MGNMPGIYKLLIVTTSIILNISSSRLCLWKEGGFCVGRPDPDSGFHYAPLDLTLLPVQPHLSVEDLVPRREHVRATDQMNYHEAPFCDDNSRVCCTLLLSFMYVCFYLVPMIGTTVGSFQ